MIDEGLNIQRNILQELPGKTPQMSDWAVVPITSQLMRHGYANCFHVEHPLTVLTFKMY